MEWRLFGSAAFEDAASTRQRVERAAEALRYRPDPAAARLATGRTMTIGLAIPILDSWYFTKVMSGAETELTNAGYDMLIFSLATEQTRHRVLTGPIVKRVDGLILVDLNLNDEELRSLLIDGVKIVTIGYELSGASKVLVDDRRLAQEAVCHLVDLGHRRIALIGGDSDDPQRFVVPKLRRSGYQDALRSHGIAIRRDYEVSGSFSTRGGYQAALQLLSLPEPPTAIFAMSDEMAFGVWRAAAERGLSIPDDISVVGVDDHELSEIIGLTTMQQEVSRHGVVAAGLLLRQLGNEHDQPGGLAVNGSLVRRASTAPPPA